MMRRLSLVAGGSLAWMLSGAGQAWCNVEQPRQFDFIGPANFQVFDPGPIHTEDVTTILEELAAGDPETPGSSVPGHIELGDAGGPGAGTPGAEALLEVFFDGLPIDFPPFTFSDLSFDIKNPDGTSGTLLPISPGGPTLVDIECDVVGCDITFDVSLNPVYPHQLHAEIDPSQTGLSFVAASAAVGPPGPTENSFIDVFFELKLTGGPIDPSQPLFTVTMTSQTPASIFALPPVGLAMLVALLLVATLLLIRRRRIAIREPL